MFRQRLRVGRSPLALLGRIVLVLFALVLVWYGAMLALLALKVAPSALQKVVAFLRDWLSHGDGKHIKIKASNGKRSFEVDLPAGEFSHDELRELLANLGAGSTSRPPEGRGR